MAEEKKKIAAVGLGEITDNGNGTFTMSDKGLTKYYEEHGIANPQDVFKAISGAREALLLDASRFLADHVIKTKETQTLKCGTGNGTVEVNLIGRRDVRNVSAGTTITQYGVTTYTVRDRIPESMKAADGELAKIASRIEEAFKNKR